MDDEMTELNWLAAQFEQNRPHLRAIAYRMLGSATEADDAVQDTWLRLTRSRSDAIENLGGWLTTVVGRVCLDMLRSRTARREDAFAVSAPDTIPSVGAGSDPEHEAVLADSVELALLVVLDTLTPAERFAFVLHDLFAVPFDEIAPIVGKTPAAARQLASRARRRVRGTPARASRTRDLARQRAVVDAFLAASRGGDLAALLRLLDPEAVFRADAAALEMGATEASGAPAVADIFAGRARVARSALVGGDVGAVWSVDGAPRTAFRFTIADGRVVAIDLVADPTSLAALDIELLEP